MQVIVWVLRPGVHRDAEGRPTGWLKPYSFNHRGAVMDWWEEFKQTNEGAQIISIYEVPEGA